MIYLDEDEPNTNSNSTTTTTTTSSSSSIRSRRSSTATTNISKAITQSQYFFKILKNKIHNIPNKKKQILFTRLTNMYHKEKKLGPRIISQILFGNSLLLRPFKQPSIGPIFLTQGKSSKLKLAQEHISQLKRGITQKNCSVYFRCFCDKPIKRLDPLVQKTVFVQIALCNQILNLIPNKPIKMDLAWFQSKTNEIMFNVSNNLPSDLVLTIVCQPMVQTTIEELIKKFVLNKTMDKDDAIHLMQKNQFGFKIDSTKEIDQTISKQTKPTTVLGNKGEIGSMIMKEQNFQNNSNRLKLNLNLDSNQISIHPTKNQSLKNNEISINLLSDTFSLRCPLSRKRIKIPSRSIKCKHLQCFDLAQFINFAEFSKKWICPCCNIKIKINELIIDGFVQEIISKCTKKNEEVTVFPNGNWSFEKIESVTNKAQKPKTNPIDIVFDPEIEDFQDLFEILNPNNSQNNQENNDQQEINNNNNNNGNDNENNINNNNTITNNNNISNTNNNITYNNNNNNNNNDSSNSLQGPLQLEMNSINFPSFSNNFSNQDNLNSNVTIRKRQFSETLPQPKQPIHQIQQSQQPQQQSINHRPQPQQQNNHQIQQSQQQQQQQQQQYIPLQQPQSQPNPQYHQYYQPQLQYQYQMPQLNDFQFTNLNYDFSLFNNSNTNTTTTNNNNNKIRRMLTTPPEISFNKFNNQFIQQPPFIYPQQSTSELGNINFNTNHNLNPNPNPNPNSNVTYNQKAIHNQTPSFNQLFFDSTNNFDQTEKNTEIEFPFNSISNQTKKLN
ncbi:zinc finger miz domain-containing protein [Anaeramoeba flamelloides]|uniref:Zinc finger miz domain-containing protein n=1 Tax=Anaeramoeba flamelloides TaxID=1746091 RepID=A0AAV7ZVM2_9EUKA|nr:zinc finger miz domain-containing protein [Anaeramoeba flamelloides]